MNVYEVSDRFRTGKRDEDDVIVGLDDNWIISEFYFVYRRVNDLFLFKLLFVICYGIFLGIYCE